MRMGANRAVREVLEMAESPMTARMIEEALEFKYDQPEIASALAYMKRREQVVVREVDRIAPRGRRKVAAFLLAPESLH